MISGTYVDTTVSEQLWSLVLGYPQCFWITQSKVMITVTFGLRLSVQLTGSLFQRSRLKWPTEKKRSYKSYKEGLYVNHWVSPVLWLSYAAVCTASKTEEQYLTDTMADCEVQLDKIFFMFVDLLHKLYSQTGWYCWSIYIISQW